MENFDVVVVGAGPAGSAAAMVLAGAGLNTLLVERSRTPGDKNLFGGRIYGHTLKKLLGSADDAPVERRVTKEMLGFMTDRECLSVDFQQFEGEHSSFTARRSKFDAWLAQRAEAAGAVLITGTKVEGLVMRDGAVSGISAGGETIACGCVIDAEGVTATLAKQAGLRKDLSPHDVKIGVKETVELGSDVIEDRFLLAEGEGAACILVGYPSHYTTAGGGFIYTNKDTLSIGVVLDANEVSSKKLEAERLMEDFRLHPYVQRYVRGGRVIEYSAHMIPSVPPPDPQALFAGGFLVAGDAGGFFINHGFTYRGVDMAIASGMAAARAAIRAHGSGGYSKEQLSCYAGELSAEIIPELRMAERTRKLLYNSRLFSIYPELVTGTARGIFDIRGFGEKGARNALRSSMRGKVSFLSLMHDLYSLYRNL